jgi:methylmalonyl-CoA mutase N-terminal domain/subunit
MIARRAALERLSLILGGALSPQMTAAVMGQVINEGASVAVTAEQTALIAELADIIIPTTDTPGAKAAGVEAFIIRVMRDCYVLEEQQSFYAGLEKLAEAGRQKHGKAFAELAPEEKIALVADATKTNKAFFKRLKELTVTGYFISEIGATQALEYLPVPGRFEGDVPMQPGQKAWAISK